MTKTMLYPDQIPMWPPQDEGVAESLQAALEDGSWGQYHSEWSRDLLGELMERFHAEEARLCCSGTIGVEIALRATGVEPGDDVLISAYDYPGNFRAIEQIGARPVLVDVMPGRWTLSLERLEAAATKATRSVIVSHLHGDMAPVGEIAQWSRAEVRGLVEDVCQAPGGIVDGIPAGAWGDVGVLSFGGSKLLTAGRGGAVLMADQQLAQRATIFAERGNDAFPMSELQAACVMGQWERFDDRHQKRLEGARLLRELLADDSPLQGQPDFEAYAEPAIYKLGFLYDAERAGGMPRDAYIEAMRSRGIPIGEGFRGFHRRSDQRCAKSGDLHNARRAAESTVLIDQTLLLAEPDVIEQAAEILRSPSAD